MENHQRGPHGKVRPEHTPSTGWLANRVHEDAKPCEQLHALVAAPRIRVGAINCIVRTEVAPPLGRERERRGGVSCGAILD